MNSLSLNTYDYELPDELIAQFPIEPADECRLLVYTKSNYSPPYKGGVGGGLSDDSILPHLTSPWQGEEDIIDTVFSSFPSLLDPEKHIFFFNESKVLRARVPLQNARSVTKTGSEKIFDGEIFYLRPHDENSFVAMVYPGDRFPVGGKIYFQDVEISVEELVYEGRLLKITSGVSTLEFLEKYGQMPLPPYVEYSPEKESVYQPVFAQKEGSVASPTASLHFTTRLLDELTEKGFGQEKVVLHVGLGTFKNIYEEDIRDFDMHVEYAEVTRELFEKIAQYKKYRKTILAIGTTVTRTLESLPFLWNDIRDSFDWTDDCRVFWEKIAKNNDNIIQSFSITGNLISFESKIFIYPSFEFCIIDELITNFHLPKSTLLMLVSAFLGIDETKKIYHHAIEKKYRFFSFGDAMYLQKNR